MVFLTIWPTRLTCLAFSGIQGVVMAVSVALPMAICLQYHKEQVGTLQLQDYILNIYPDVKTCQVVIPHRYMFSIHVNEIYMWAMNHGKSNTTLQTYRCSVDEVCFRAGKGTLTFHKNQLVRYK